MFQLNINWRLFPFTGQSAAVGLSRTVVDNQDLGWSAIARTSCLTPGDRNPTWTDADLNYGVNYNYGYTMDSCTMTSKTEMLARELLFCTFSPLQGDNMERCSSNQSVAFFRSFIDRNQTATPDLPVFYIDNKVGLRKRYEKPCPGDCIQDRFVLRIFFSSTRPSYGLLPVLGPLEVVQTPTLDSALLCSSRAGADLGQTS